MFTNEWRDHWGLETDPFSCEDADKDFVLAEIDTSAVHSGFDRIYGDPRMPAPGIVFGEKGSGKSSLRLMMKRRLDAHNEAHPDARVFVLEYIEFNGFLEHFRGMDSASAERVLKAWSLSDHIDSILSLATTKLVDGCLSGEEKHDKLSRKQKLNLLLLTGLYYDSVHHTAAHAQNRLAMALRIWNGPKVLRGFVLVLATLLGALAAVFPHIEGAPELGPAEYWYAGGAALIALAWGRHGLLAWSRNRRARRAATSVRVLPRDAAPIARALGTIPGRERAEYTLPRGDREEARYELLQRLTDLTEVFGYRGWYVLMDRVDEPSLLSGDSALMSRFIEKLLDIKLLQHPGLALKLFLPIELESLYRTAQPEDLKSMRLDKSNLIPELKWTGQELYEIANGRLKVCLSSGSRLERLADLFEEDFEMEYLKSTLEALGTPRYCFGFLSALVMEHVRELPGDLPEGDPAWRVPRMRFDVVRAAWIDRTGLLRRTMN